MVFEFEEDIDIKVYIYILFLKERIWNSDWNKFFFGIKLGIIW